MDFLKYLDVMIGLAVVMVLLSPLVTAFTHVWMWACNGRSVYLLQALQRLILQLEANPSAVMTVEAGGARVPNATIEPFGATNAVGELWLPNGVADHRQASGLVNVKVSAAGAPLGGAIVRTTLIPQKIRERQQVVSGPTDASGATKIAYVYTGPQGYSSYEAQLVVRDAAGAKVAAAVVCTVDGIPSSVAVTAAAAGDFAHPASPNAPASYEIACTVTVGGAPAAGHVVEADFVRNTRFDRLVESTPTQPNGEVSLTLGVMTEALALTVANAVVRHPMVARTPMAGPWSRFPPFRNVEAEVVEREEVIRILLELASGEGPGAAHLTGTSREALLGLLAANGIPNPGESLARVRAEAQKMEHEKPDLASHVRHTRAIVEGAKSDFVGKLTQWFDAAMARATQQYAAKARVFTMVGAGLVAVVLQLNSVDLLQRLATDSKLRDALVVEAKNEAERIDKLARETAAAGQNSGTTTSTPTDGSNGTAASDGGATDDLQRARAKHKHIEENLAILRRPDLSIVPDHFVWQRVPRGRLARNPLWTSPYPASLELVVGGASYAVRPRWEDDPLLDIAAAVAAAGAPVDAQVVEGAEYVVFQSDEPIGIDIVPLRKQPPVGKAGGSPPASDGAAAKPLPQAEPLRNARVAYAVLSLADATARFKDTHNLEKSPIHLAVDHQSVNVIGKDTPAALKTFTRATFGSTMAALIPAADKRVAVTCRDAKNEPTKLCTATEGAVYLVAIARDPRVKTIRLLANPDDPYSNLLSTVSREARAWRVPKAAVDTASQDRYSVRPFRTPLLATSAQGSLALTLHGCDATAGEPVAMRDQLLQLDLPSCRPRPTPAEQKAVAGTPPEQKLAADTAPPAGEPIDLPTTLRVTAARHRDGDLVITSHRRGPLELRYTAGQPESNMLNPQLEYVYDWDPDQRDMLGVILTWALLSLGAPFWFDALKNLLKLRPAPAATEQQNREERMKDTTKR